MGLSEESTRVEGGTVEDHYELYSAKVRFSKAPYSQRNEIMTCISLFSMVAVKIVAQKLDRDHGPLRDKTTGDVQFFFLFLLAADL